MEVGGGEGWGEGGKRHKLKGEGTGEGRGKGGGWGGGREEKDKTSRAIRSQVVCMQIQAVGAITVSGQALENRTRVWGQAR